MGPNRRRKPSEQLRSGRQPAEGLALVARDGDRLVGAVRLWDVAATEPALLLLGPLAVEPTLQGTGVGAALMRIAIARAGQSGHRAIVMVGDPEYYGRFGFIASATEHLAKPGPIERRRFLGLELVRNGFVGAFGVLLPTGELAGATLPLAA